MAARYFVECCHRNNYCLHDNIFELVVRFTVYDKTGWLIQGCVQGRTGHSGNATLLAGVFTIGWVFKYGVISN
jgi:hypothetical protein